MPKVSDIANWMESISPLRLSEEWDNTGLLLGDTDCQVRKLMTCLTLTPESAFEAIGGKANLVISHHPLPFRPLKKIVASDLTGRLLWQLANAGVSVYCPHTAWDSATRGINAQLATVLELLHVKPLIAVKAGMFNTAEQTEQADHGDQGQVELGAGRVGDLRESLQINAFAKLVAAKVPHCRLRAVDCGREIRRIGIACGSGGSLLEAAVRCQCDLLLTGEATFHQCLDAKAAGVSILLIGHFASEKFAMNRLAELCGQAFSDVEVWGSRSESDPVSPL